MKLQSAKACLNHFLGYKRDQTLEVGYKYQNFRVKDWKVVLFTDEPNLQTCSSNKRLYVKRPTGERMIQQCFKATVKHGGKDYYQFLWSFCSVCFCCVFKRSYFI